MSCSPVAVISAIRPVVVSTLDSAVVAVLVGFASAEGTSIGFGVDADVEVGVWIGVGSSVVGAPEVRAAVAVDFGSCDGVSVAQPAKSSSTVSAAVNKAVKRFIFLSPRF